MSRPQILRPAWHAGDCDWSAPHDLRLLWMGLALRAWVRYLADRGDGIEAVFPLDTTNAQMFARKSMIWKN